MSVIKLSTGYSVLPEGEYIFKIESVSYREEFGKLEIRLVTYTGQRHTEYFTFIKQDGSTNNVALNIFSNFARIAMDNKELEEIDPEKLVGKFVKGKIEHTQIASKREAGKMVTFARFACESSVSGFDINLDSILE